MKSGTILDWKSNNTTCNNDLYLATTNHFAEFGRNGLDEDWESLETPPF